MADLNGHPPVVSNGSGDSGKGGTARLAGPSTLLTRDAGEQGQPKRRLGQAGDS
jgi:hypothetical protein